MFPGARGGRKNPLLNHFCSLVAVSAVLPKPPGYRNVTMQTTNHEVTGKGSLTTGTGCVLSCPWTGRLVRVGWERPVVKVEVNG